MQTPHIRTPDQRLRIFVSSTLHELADERAAARDAIQRIRLTPVMFELGARAHPPKDLYRAYLAQSDVFLGIYGQRYGWVAPGEELSGLEDEYRLSRRMPKLIYVKRTPDREDRLQSMLRDIERDDKVCYRPFDRPEELVDLVQNDLALMLTERFAGASPPADPEPDDAPATPWLPPVERGDLIGRQDIAARIEQLLADKATSILTLIGPGGTGKTRLAVHAAHACAPVFADGVFYVPLAAVRHANDVPGHLVKTLAIPSPPSGGVEPSTLLTNFLKTRQALLVLDNFEQVLGAAPMVGQIVAASPLLKVLVTSREPLQIRGERELPVPPLDHNVSPSRPISPAMVMFEARARELRPDFSITAENRDTVAAICRRLDALPLAIELAASRIRVLTPAAMLPRLDKCLSLLTSGRRDAPERQQTLRGALAWSYDLLAPQEAAFFRRLGTFQGSFDESAANAVTADVDIDCLDALTGLAQKSLLAVTEANGEPRYHLLETVREFALEKLAEAGEEGATRRKHCVWAHDLLERAVQGVGTGRGRPAWHHRIALEGGNVRSAIRFCAASGDPTDADFLWKLYVPYQACLISDGRTVEAQHVWEEVRGLAPSQDPLWRARSDVMTGWVGAAAMSQDEMARLARGVEGLRPYPPDGYLIGGLTMLGMAALFGSDGTSDLLEEAIDLSEQTQQSYYGAWARTLLCYAMVGSGRLDEAEASGERLLADARRVGSEDGIAFAVGVSARIALARGDLETSRKQFAESVAIARAHSARWPRSDSLVGLAGVVLALGDRPAARQLLEEALALFAEMGASGHCSDLCGALAGLLLDDGDRTTAGMLLGAAAGGEATPVEMEAFTDPTGALRAEGARAAERVGALTTDERGADMTSALRHPFRARPDAGQHTL